MSEKKSVWDFLDSVLPSATSVYGKIREKETGINPFNKPKTEEDLLKQSSFGTGIGTGFQTPKKNNTIWYVLGGLVVVGAGTYFFIKKYKK